MEQSGNVKALISGEYKICVFHEGLLQISLQTWLYWLTRYLSEDMLTSMRSSPTRTFSPSDLCLEDGWTIHQHVSPKPHTENIQHRFHNTEAFLYHLNIFLFTYTHSSHHHKSREPIIHYNTFFIFLQTHIKRKLVSGGPRWRQAAEVLEIDRCYLKQPDK